MARFKGLTQIIQEQIAETVKYNTRPPISPHIIETGQSILFQENFSQKIKGIFIWGESVWGIDRVVNAWYPDELEETDII